MKRILPTALALAILFTTLASPVTVPGQTPKMIEDEPVEQEDDTPVQRVARLSFIEGDVSFLRAGVDEWAAAAENLPLFAGDQIYTGRGARGEIQLGRGNYVRLSENTALTITEMSDSEAQLEMTEGMALIRLERFGAAFSRFEIDTPNAAVLLEQDGFYRINVRSEEESEIIARRGSMEVTTEDGSFKVREGNRLFVNTGADRRLEIAADTSFDNWDQWSGDRDTAINATTDTTADPPDSSSLSIVSSVVSVAETIFSSFFGASELSSYGHWINDSSYGACWVPRVGSGWAPYRNGQWLWVPNVGWTWLSSERWGWAPYHYGRWAFLPNVGWAWIPGFRSGSYYSHSYYRWRPGLVYFFNCQTPRGNYVGWYPLRPGERWRRPDRDRRPGDHSHLQYPIARDGHRRPDSDGSGRRRPRERDGVTVLPIDGFARPGKALARPEAPSREIVRWFDRGAREGLPEITPGNDAAAPTWRGNGPGQRPLRAFSPPPHVLNRPVVTRKRPADSPVAKNPPRERKLLQPSKDRPLIVRPVPKNSLADQGEAEKDSQGERTRSWGGIRPRPSNPGPAQDTSGDRKQQPDRERSRERKERERKQDNDKQDNNANGSERLKNRSRERLIPAPEPKVRDAQPEKPRANPKPARENRPPAAERPQNRPQPKVERQQAKPVQPARRGKGNNL